ncbi:hypothetical protein D3C87_1969530 [compost metagenome]
MKGDFSQLNGDPETISFKINLYNHIHQGFKSIDDAKITFNKDILILKPILDQIENEITEKISGEKTIIIKDNNFFENKQDLSQIQKTLSKLE